MVGELQALLENHGLMLVFLNVLVEQAGLPVPAYPMLFVAGDPCTGSFASVFQIS